MDLKKAFKIGVTGKIQYNNIEESYQLSQEHIDLGIMSEGFWQDYENKVVKITIEIIGDTQK